MIVDFDGTLAALDLDWGALRTRLGVVTLAELWDRPRSAWDEVTAAEVLAARAAGDGPAVALVEADADPFAVLTANSERAVVAWLARRPHLAVRCVAVVGRESLRGPKHDRACFDRGFTACRAALQIPPVARKLAPTHPIGPDRPLVYVSDAEWELDLAADHGARVVSVAPA